MVAQHALEQALAVLERDVEQRATVEVQQVERLVDEPLGGLVAEPGLEEREVRAAVVVDGDDLPVDDRLAGVDPRRRAEQAREVGLGILEVPGPDADLAIGDDGLDAIAVPLDLEQPVRVVERLRREGGEHRLDPGGQRRGLGAREVDLGGRGRRLPDPEGVAVSLDLVVGPAGLDALRVVLGVPAGLRRIVLLVDQQPLLALVVLEGGARRRAGAAAGPDDREAALHLLAAEAELQLAVGDGLPRIERRRLGLPGAPVPDDDVAGAVLLGGDDALEVEVLDRVVLDVDRHPPDGRVERGALGHGPGHEHALDLQPEVVVEPGRPMALDDEAPGRAGDGGGRRLRGLGEVALATVFLERHPPQFAGLGSGTSGSGGDDVSGGAVVAGRCGPRRCQSQALASSSRPRAISEITR